MVHDYHSQQYENCYETTSGLLQLVEHQVPDVDRRSLLDVACGAGANVYHMLRRWPDCNVTGVDLDESLLEYARAKLPREFAGRCRYEQANLFDLPTKYEPDAFDITTLMQTLLLFGPDEYAEVIRSLMKVTSEWIFLSSLFTDKQMDVTSQIRDYVRFGPDSKEYISYNVLCMSRFRRVCDQLGVKEIIFRDFWISVDLSGPAAGGIGTYTVRRDDGRRLQFSGAVFMPWKFAALRLK